MYAHTRSISLASIAATLVVIGTVLVSFHSARTAASASASSPQHYVFDRDTTFTTRFVLHPGDSVELRNGACLCFERGGSADWRGTPTSTWDDDGRTQNLERDIEITGSGHIRFGPGSKTSTIRYVEIDLRPPLQLAKYPLHFHHAGDGVRGTLVEGVVIKNSTNRAFVPHGSHGITFRHTIAKNIVGDAYWWDPPPPGDREDRSNNSSDITFDHALIDGVNPFPGDHGHRLSGFTLGAGTGNAVINSAAINVSGGVDSSGFHWPEQHHNQPGSWRFENNVAHHNRSHGIFVWQNDDHEHIINAYHGYANGRSDIEHGAYANHYDYRNINADTVAVIALGWSVRGGAIGTITALNHRIGAAPVTFTDVTVGRLIVDNTGSGAVPGHYIFTNTGLTFNDVTVQSAVQGTQVTINGETRSFAGSNTPGHPIGLVDPSQGMWHLRSSNGSVTSFFYGNPNDFPFMGDWDCDGDDTPGLFRQSDAFAYLRNSNTQGNADRKFFLGNPNDIPLAGDFNGNGCDTLSIYRPSTQQFFIVNALGKDGGGLGSADISFIFGNPGDKPVVGDWDGDGIDEVGLHRESTGFFYFRNTLDTGIAHDQFYFGNPGDRFVAGDWGVVDGRDTPAVFRPSNTTVYFRHTLTPGGADSQFRFGRTGWLPVAGEFGLG